MYFACVPAIAIRNGPRPIRHGSAAPAQGGALTRLEHVILNAAVAESAFQQIIAGDRAGTSVALGHQHGWINASMDQRVAHGVRALLRQRDVRRRIAVVVGLAGDLQHGTGGKLLDLPGSLLQKRRRCGRYLRSFGWEVDDRLIENASQVFCVKARL